MCLRWPNCDFGAMPCVTMSIVGELPSNDMSVRTRLEDAELLAENGRGEGAFFSVLIAFAATARKRYPKPLPDSEAFERLFNDEQQTIFAMEKPFRINLAFPFRGNKIILGKFLYKYVRCELTHESQLPQDVWVVLGEDEQLDSHTPTATIGILKICRFKNGVVLYGPWRQRFAVAVRNAPENASLFMD